MGKLRVALVDDHHLVRQAVEQQFAGQPDLAVVARLAYAGRLLDTLRRTGVDVLLLDLGMEQEVFDPVSMIARIRGLYPQIRIIVLSSMAYGEAALGVLRSGVHGYVLKNDPASQDLPAIVRRVLAGLPYYSPAIEDLLAEISGREAAAALLDAEERYMLHLASQGHTNRQIGFLLGFSEKTVRNRFTPIFRKLGATNRVEAIRRAQAMGLLSGQDGAAQA
jgi:DNA-binding NarL/FixJ family response regulator